GAQGASDGPAVGQRPALVGFDVQPAAADRQQSWAGRVGAEVGGDVGGVHDAGQAGQRRVAAQIVFVDEDLEGAFAVAVVIAGAGGVEADRVLAGCGLQDLPGGDVQDLGVRVDELGDQPGAGDPVGLGPGAGDPLHD